MRKERFDFAFALGSGCYCSRMLREKKLQFASFPLDWVGAPTRVDGNGLRLAADIVAGDFADWFLATNLKRAPESDNDKYDGYVDCATGLHFTHDFLKGADWQATYAAEKAKYDRRIARFLKCIGRAKSVLMVWVADPRDKGRIRLPDVRYCLDVLKAKFPKKRLFLVVASCVPDLPVERAEIVREAEYESYAFDFRVETEGPPTWEVRSELFDPILSRFGVVDYRTWRERWANRKRERAIEFEKFKARSTVECWVRKLQFKLYRHLRRNLARKGILAGLEPERP